MKRHNLRINTFIMLYLNEFHPCEDMEEQLVMYIDKLEQISKKDVAYIHDRLFDIINKLEVIDQKISESTIGWSIDRMSKVDLSIMRLACYEILFDDEVPNVVAIDEAVEIAKIYGGDGSPGFINGVLATLLKK